MEGDHRHPARGPGHVRPGDGRVGRFPPTGDRAAGSAGGGGAEPRPPGPVRPPDPDSDRIWLIEISEPGTDRRREELRGRADVGSGVDPAAGGLLLVDRRVAARHLVLDGSDDVLWVHDLGSDHGTTIDGVRVGGSAEAPVGCSILLGDSQIRVDGWV